MSQFERKTTPDYYRLYPRPSYLLLWCEPTSVYNRRRNLLAGQKSKQIGLSRNSAMKMKRALNWLVAAAEYKSSFEKKKGGYVTWRINFITLTVPQQGDTTDVKVKRMLNKLFQWMAYNCGLSNYVWRSETQARGDIHLHIVTDVYIHWTDLKYQWNKLLRKNGLAGKHTDPNSTDVHAVEDGGIENLNAYVVDYMMKKDTDKNGNVKREIKGRKWGCSKALSNAGKQFIYMDEGEAESIHLGMIGANWQRKQIENTRSGIYMVSDKKANMYQYIADGDETKHIYESELKKIRSTQKQLDMYKR